MDKAEAHTGYGCTNCKSSWLPKKYIESIKYTNHFEPKEFWLKVSKMQQSQSRHKCPTGCGHLTELEKLSGMSFCSTCSGVLFQPKVLKHWLKQYPAKEDPHILDKAFIGIGVLELITSLLK